MFDKIKHSARSLFGYGGNSSNATAAAGSDEPVPLRSRAVGGRVSLESYALDSDTFPPGGLPTFVRMQRDAQVRACLTTKRLAVLSENAEVHPADDTPGAKQAASVVASQIARLPGGASGIISGALDSLAMGYAVGEYDWAPDGTLARIKWHDPRRFTFIADAAGDISHVEVVDANLAYDVSRFVLYAHQSRYGNPYGESDLAAAYEPFTRKQTIRRMWFVALDRFGTPTPVVTFPRSASQDEINRIVGSASRSGTASALSVPEGWQIDAPLDTGRVEPGAAFVTAIRYEDEQIARAILGQDLTSTGGSGTGSYALGKISQGISDDWIQSLRVDLAARVLTAQVARTITLFALGPDAPVPIVTFPNLTDSELAARRDLIEKMISGSVIAPTEGWIRTYLGLPEG